MGHAAVVLRGEDAFAACRDPDSYVASQILAERLLAEGALGIAYPSARRPPGDCLTCFRPALVTNVRMGGTYRFSWDEGGGMKSNASAESVAMLPGESASAEPERLQGRISWPAA